jgi:charged multivesicular body protein 2A
MAFLFGGGRRADTENAKDFQRQINASGRGMEREVVKLNVQEKKMLLEMKRMGQTSDLAAATNKAKELIRLRAHRTRLSTMRAHLGQLSQQLQSVSGTQKIQDVVFQTTRMLQTLNKRYDPRQVSRMLQEFEKQNTMMGLKQEVLEDGLDDAFEVDGEITFAEDEVARVMQEVGLDQGVTMGQAQVAWNTGRQEDTLASRLSLLQAGGA